MNADLHKLRQWGYDALADEIAEGIKRWDDGLKRRRPALIERYLKWHHGFHIHAGVTDRIGANDGIAGEHCIWLHFAGVNLEIDNLSENGAPFLCVYEADAHAEVAAKLSTGWVKDAGVDGSMLVDAVKFIDLPEGVVPIHLPTVVRLQALDNCPWFVGDAPDFFPFLVGPHGVLIKDRELGSLDLGCGHVSIVDPAYIGLREGERQMVERATEIMDTVANYEQERISNGVNRVDPKPPVLSSDILLRLFKRWVRVWLNRAGIIGERVM